MLVYAMHMTDLRDGLCRQTDPELFFPEPGGDYEPAKRVCRACPVLPECFAWTMENIDQHVPGVWGGTTPTNRRTLKRKMMVAA